MSENYNLYDKIKILCNENDITIASLEKATGISKGNICKWNSSLPSIDNLVKIADYFNLTIDELIGRNKIVIESDTLNGRIKLLANKADISIPCLEVELGLGNCTISHWKNSSPTVEKIKQVADYFGVTIDYLVSGGKEGETSNIKSDYLNIAKEAQDKEINPLYMKYALELLIRLKEIDQKGEVNDTCD